MIVATHNCGCPAKLPSSIPQPLELQAPCFQSYGSHSQTAQHTPSRIIKKSTQVYPTSEAYCCTNCKSFHHVPSCSKYNPSTYLSSVSPQYSHCCAADAFRRYSTSSHRPGSAAAISASGRSVNKQFPRSRSESKLKNLEMSSTDQVPTDKIVSEIVRDEQPYKEIEAVINDNRVVIRTQKKPVREEYDPPCECIGQVASEVSALSQRKCDDGVVFDMAHGSLKLCRTSREDAPSTKETCEETGCRTVTLYPSVKDDARDEVKKSKIVRPIDLEENPNIFLLRIRKHCDSGDKRRTIDLEFRAPRPWLSKKKEDLLKPETLEEDADRKYEDGIDKEHEDETDKEHADEHEDDINENTDVHEEIDEWKI